MTTPGHAEPPPTIAAAADEAPIRVGRGGGRGAHRLILQTLGFVIGLGLLWWCAKVALSENNREQLSRLADASLWQIAAMVALTLASLALNGSLFWVTLRPIKKLRWGDVVAVNIIATLLALLPFKLSVLFRILIHRTRDGVPLLTIGAWFSAMAVILLIVVAPVGAAGFLAARAASEGATGTPVWWPAVPAAAAMVAAIGVISISRIVGTPYGWRFVESLTRLVPGSRPRELFKAQLLPKAHEGVRMLGAPGPVGAAVLMRLADIAVQTARFLLAASIVQQTLSLELAVLAASTYFLIGVLAPTGSLGVREAGTAGVFAALTTEGFMVVVITITAAETIVLLGAAVAAAAWLRLDKIVRFRAPQPRAQ